MATTDDEGMLAHAARLRDDGVAVEVCYPGQPHGFINYGYPAATGAWEHIGSWVRALFSSAS